MGCLFIFHKIKTMKRQAMVTETCLSSNSNSCLYTTPPIHLADEPFFVSIAFPEMNNCLI